MLKIKMNVRTVGPQSEVNTMVPLKVIRSKLEIQYTGSKHLEYKTKITQLIILPENIQYMEYMLQKMCKTSTLKTRVQILLRNYRRSRYMEKSTMFMDQVTTF